MTDITVQDRLEALAILAETRLERIEKQQAEIERLRNLLVAAGNVTTAAAKENERPRQEKAELEAGWQRTYDHDVGKLREEIERLHRAYAELDALRHTVCDQRDQYKAEIEEQREFIKAWILEDRDDAKEIERLLVTIEVPKADVWLRADYRDIVHRLGEVHLIRACEHQHDDDFVPMYGFQVIEQYQLEAEKLRREAERAMNDALDWNRLRSGDNRALNPDHQDVFDMVAEQRAEIEQLREELRDTTWQDHADYWQKIATELKTHVESFAIYRDLLREGLEEDKSGEQWAEYWARVREELGDE